MQVFPRNNLLRVERIPTWLNQSSTQPNITIQTKLSTRASQVSFNHDISCSKLVFVIDIEIAPPASSLYLQVFITFEMYYSVFYMVFLFMIEFYKGKLTAIH